MINYLRNSAFFGFSQPKIPSAALAFAHRRYAKFVEQASASNSSFRTSGRDKFRRQQVLNLALPFILLLLVH